MIHGVVAESLNQLSATCACQNSWTVQAAVAEGHLFHMHGVLAAFRNNR